MKAIYIKNKNYTIKTTDDDTHLTYRNNQQITNYHYNHTSNQLLINNEPKDESFHIQFKNHLQTALKTIEDTDTVVEEKDV